MPLALHDRELRLRLEPRAKPYFARLCDGVCIGYRKGKVTSRWVIRRYEGGAYRMSTIASVVPDDTSAADGRRVLDYQQVVAKIMSDDARIPLKCSFCSKSAKEVRKLIAGAAGFICDACVVLCQLYLDHPDETGRLVVDARLQPSRIVQRRWTE